MNWTDSKTIPSLLVGTYVCVYLVRVHTDYSWYFPCYTAFGIFKGCRNDFNVVMRGSLKSRTSVPISSFSAISNRQTIFSLNHRALLRQSFHFWTAGLLLGSLNKSNQDFFFKLLVPSKGRLRKLQLTAQHQLNYGSQATCNIQKEFAIQLYISAALPNAMQTTMWLCCCSKKNSSRDFLFCTSPPIYWQGNWGQQLSLRGEHINIYGEYHWAEGEFLTLEL